MTSDENDAPRLRSYIAWMDDPNAGKAWYSGVHARIAVHVFAIGFAAFLILVAGAKLPTAVVIAAFFLVPLYIPSSRSRAASIPPDDPSKCHECQYDLTGLPGVEVKGLYVGPPKCPECGHAWPIITQAPRKYQRRAST